MANPSSATTPNLGLQLIYEGIKVDNDLLNSNYIKIDQAIGGSQMYEKLVGTLTNIDLHKNGTSSAIASFTYPTTDFDFMKIKMYSGAGNTGSNTAGAYGYAAMDTCGELKIVKPTANIKYYIPVYYQSGIWGTRPWDFTTTGFSFTQNNAEYRTDYAIEFYKYSTT